ncbi:hypothetical protein [Nocardioides pacificus]
MTDIEDEVAQVDVEGSLTLSVGWRSGQKTKLAQVAMGDDVAAELRGVLRATVVDLQERSPEPWAPDADLSPETYLWLPRGDLGDAPVLASEHQGLSLAEALAAAETLMPLTPGKLPTQDLTFYALTVGSTPGERVSFLRRTNPRRGLKGGRVLTSLHDVLTRISDPIFAFDDLVDLVFVGDRVCVLSQTSFVALFRTQQVLIAQVPGWSAELAAHVEMTEDGRARLTAKAIRDSRAKTRLEAIVRRGHLANVSASTIKTRMVDVGLDPTLLLDANGRLRLDDDDIPTVLQFLNEDLFVGALTNVGFRADRKAQR